jgi:hypothetical protein
MAFGRRKGDSTNLGKWNWDFRIGKSVFEDWVYVNGGGETQQRNIDNDKFRVILDLETASVGWIAYLKGEGLNAHLVRIGEDYGDAPSDKHREGLRIVVKTDEALGGEVRELVTTSRILWDLFDALHTEFLAQIPAHPGCLPVVDIVGMREEKIGSEPIYIPIFKIVGWMPRPPELPAAGIPLVKRVKKSDDGADSAEFGTVKEFKRPRPNDDMGDEMPF